MTELQQALINSGNVETLEAAEELIVAMKKRVFCGEDPEEVLYEYGLEPDYVMEILPY